MTHDLKHLVKKKRFRLPFLRSNSPVRSRLLVETRLRQRALRIILPALALMLAAWPVRSLVRGNSTAFHPQPKREYLKSLDSNQSLRLCSDSLSSCRISDGKLTASTPDGGVISYCIDPTLQSRVRKVMEENRVPYAAFVAIEPKTGRVLALEGYSFLNASWGENSCFGIYPMASLFKMVTAAAAFEQRKAGPETMVAFAGKNTSENPKYWTPGRRAQQVNLSVAMGKSINPVFGRLASDFVGKDYLMTMTDRFGFNQALFPGTQVTPSTAPVPTTDAELKLMGAGLGREVKISPFHVALIMSALANDGMMPQPVLADRIVNGRGETVQAGGGGEGRRVLSPEIARQLGQALSLTVKSGTSRKAFHDRRGRMKLASIDIAAKTGSINGKNPDGHYSWFAAYAPAKDPQIALAALVVNDGKWKIKASNLGEQALEAYFQ